MPKASVGSQLSFWVKKKLGPPQKWDRPKISDLPNGLYTTVASSLSLFFCYHVVCVCFVK